jgi:hypothetical protein
MKTKHGSQKFRLDPYLTINKMAFARNFHKGINKLQDYDIFSTSRNIVLVKYRKYECEVEMGSSVHHLPNSDKMGFEIQQLIIISSYHTAPYKLVTCQCQNFARLLFMEGGSSMFWDYFLF